MRYTMVCQRTSPAIRPHVKFQPRAKFSFYFIHYDIIFILFFSFYLIRIYLFLFFLIVDNY